MQLRRAGFTLIEVLVAVVLIDAALLALVAASVVLVRSSGDLRVREAAVRAADTRLALLAAAPCMAVTGAAGSIPPAPGYLAERWSVSPRANGTREIRDSVAFVGAGNVRSVVAATRLPC